MSAKQTMEGLMTTQSKTQDREAEVLFQKLGNTWYIFTEINNELVYSAMPKGMDPKTTKLELYDVIEDHMKKVSNQPRFAKSAA